MGQFLVQEARKVPGVQNTVPGMGSLGGRCAQEVRGLAPCFYQNLGTAGNPGAGARQGIVGAEPSRSLMAV